MTRDGKSESERKDVRRENYSLSATITTGLREQILHQEIERKRKKEREEEERVGDEVDGNESMRMRWVGRRRRRRAVLLPKGKRKKYVKGLLRWDYRSNG